MKKTTLRRVTKRSAESIVTDHLRSYILSGAVKPGTRLTEIALAEHMGVARATLRTGLHRLTTEGIVTQMPYIGWQVAELTEHDVWELWTLRGALEGMAARLVAQNMTPESRAQIEQAADALRHACEHGSIHQANECDFALHRTLIDTAGHTRLANQYRLVEQQILLYIASSNALAGEDLNQIMAQHEPLIQALLDADPQRAAQEALWHNETEGKKLEGWLRDHAAAEHSN